MDQQRMEICNNNQYKCIFQNIWEGGKISVFTTLRINKNDTAFKLQYTQTSLRPCNIEYKACTVTHTNAKLRLRVVHGSCHNFYFVCFRLCSICFRYLMFISFRINTSPIHQFYFVSSHLDSIIFKKERYNLFLYLKIGLL